MNITNIIFRKTFDSGKLRAIASITIDGCFTIHEVKVIQTDHLFIAMPCRTDTYGVTHDIAHPIGAYKEYISAHETSEIENFTA